MKFKLPIQHFFRDRHGNLVVWQAPNALLWAWLVLKGLIFFLQDGSVKTNLGQLASAVLFAWAYLELTDGDSRFRRFLGLLVIVFTTISFFT